MGALIIQPPLSAELSLRPLTGQHLSNDLNVIRGG